MLRSKVTVAAVVVTLLAIAAAPSAAQEIKQETKQETKQQEAKLIAVLKSDAPLKAKADACRMLSRVGTAKAVPPLVALLDDEKLAHMARYALEPMPAPEVDDALRSALGRLKGLRLVGVIGSVGVRRDAKAADALAKLLADADAQVARAAARALGKIGTAAAAKALTAALADVPAANRPAFCEGLFRCAERLARQGSKDQAIALYDRLRSLPKAPHQVRTGALRGAVLTRGKDGLPLLIEALGDKEYVVFSAACRTSLELGGAEATAALAGELAKLPAERQVLLIQTLGARGDAAAGDALLAKARKGPEQVRLAAVRALTRLGHAPAVAVLTELALTGKGAVAEEARKCLANFPAKKGQAAILAMLEDKDANARRLAAEMIAQRSLTGAVPALLKAAEDRDQTVRVACLKALRALAGSDDLDALLGLLMKAKTPEDIEAAEAAVRAVCTRQAAPSTAKIVIRKAVYGALPNGPSADVTKKVARMVQGGATSVEASNGNFGDPVRGTPKKLRVDYTVDGATMSKTVAENDTLTFTVATTPPAVVDALCAALRKAPTPAKGALLRLLRAAGGAKALKTVQAAAADANADVKDTALRALCDWPTADALPTVAELARSAKDRKLKILALRGYIRLAGQQNAPPAKKAESLKDALALADRTDEKRLALSALGNVPHVDALALIMPFVDSADLKEEACLAAVGVAEKIARSHPKEVAEAMQKVAQRTANKKLAQRANALARRGRR